MVKIAFASKNHLGLNSDIGSEIVNSEYITVAEIDDGKLKKVRNIENIFYGNQNVDKIAFAGFIAESEAKTFVIMHMSDEIKSALNAKKISIKLVKLDRIADILKEFI